MRAVNDHGGVAGLMAASLSDLERIPGVGPVKAIELKAALELGRRVALASADERMVIRTPRDVVDLVSAGMSHLDSEHLRIVLLSSKNHVMGIRELYRGTLNSSVVRIAELFRDAIRENCASVIVVHNHPSGDPSPSPEDIRMTADAVKAGALLDISVLDHVIIGSRTLQWVSLRNDAWVSPTHRYDRHAQSRSGVARQVASPPPTRTCDHRQTGCETLPPLLTKSAAHWNERVGDPFASSRPNPYFSSGSGTICRKFRFQMITLVTYGASL